MDKDLKKKWVKAPRSGKYKQGFRCLRTDDGRYCCLGVLCKVARAKDEDLLGCYLPSDLARRAKVALRTQHHLGRLNDGWGGEPSKSFLEIADYIEARL